MMENKEVRIMAQTEDWLPTSRQGQLDIAKKWLNVLKAAESGGKWSIPGGVLPELEELTDAAEAALAIVKNEEICTPAAITRSKTAFEALIAKMRDIKKWYFL